MPLWNRLFCKAGAAIVSIALSIYLWNQPLPDYQFWTLNAIDLVFVVTALTIPLRRRGASPAVKMSRAVGEKGWMTLRSIPETIDSLRATLRRLEQTTDAPRDSLDFARLKHILLKRIAELEIEQAHSQTRGGRDIQACRLILTFAPGRAANSSPTSSRRPQSPRPDLEPLDLL